MSKTRLPFGLAECGRRTPEGEQLIGCGKAFATELLGPADAGPALIRWDRRPKGPVGWRIGVPDWGAMKIPDSVVRCCKACGGRVTPPEPPKIWKAAHTAWADTKATDPWFEMKGRRGGK